MTEFKHGDRVRAYGHKYGTEPDGEEWYYKFEMGNGKHAVSRNNVDYSNDRVFDRVEKVVDVTVPKRGDKVRVYGHYIGEVPDGTIGTYREYQEVYKYPHRVDNVGTYGSGLSFARVEVVDAANELEDYKYKVLLPLLDQKQAIHKWPQHEYDQVLKDLDITRPSPLPIGKNALVESNSGYVYIRLDTGKWFNIATGTSIEGSLMDSYYSRTIFEGEK